jgi:glycosyltransferase involved in cell wall biosynthesis
MTKALVSVIIPCYNYGRFIEQTINSLQSQTYNNWEAIIVNDGSSDNTEEVVLKLASEDSRIKYVYQKNAGVSAARNNGISNSKGKFVLFLDADDLMSKNKLDGHIKHFEEMPELDISYANFFFFKDGIPEILYNTLNLEPNTKFDIIKIEKGGIEEIIPHLLIGNLWAVHSVCLRMELVKKVGKWDESLAMGEDWNYWFRCIVDGGIAGFLDNPESYTLIRVHNTSVSQDTFAMQKAEVLVMRYNYGYLQSQLNKKDYDLFISNLDSIFLAIERRRIKSIDRQLIKAVKPNEYLRILTKIGAKRFIKASASLIMRNIKHKQG